jgi:hypothetical protein
VNAHRHEQELAAFKVDLRAAIQKFHRLARAHPNKQVRSTLCRIYALRLEQSLLAIFDANFRKHLERRNPQHDEELLELMEFLENVDFHARRDLVVYEAIVHRGLSVSEANRRVEVSISKALAKRPSGVGQHVVDAPDFRLRSGNAATWIELADMYCPCGRKVHPKLCADRLRHQAARLHKIYLKYADIEKK